MPLHQYAVSTSLKTAALDGALLVFCPGSGATAALTDDLLAVFIALQHGPATVEPLLTRLQWPADETHRSQLDNCLRLLRERQLVRLVDGASAA